MRVIDRVSARVAELHRHRVRLIAATALGALAFLVCVELAGDPGWFWRILWVLSLVMLLIEPQGGTIGIHLATSLLLWFIGRADPDTWWSLPAAAALLLTFTAHTLHTSGPESAPLPKEIVEVWRRRAVVCLALSVVSGALILTLAGRDQRQGAWMTAAALAIIAGGLVLLPRYVGPGDGPDDRGPDEPSAQGPSRNGA